MARDKRKKSQAADRRRPIKKKTSILSSESIDWVDYKDVNLLRRFMSERAKIRARRVTGNNAQQQRAVARAIRIAREMALLPYSVRQVTQRSRGGRRDRRRGDRGGSSRRVGPGGRGYRGPVVKVVLRDDIENVGRKGDLIEVTDGFARNYLVPRGLAMKATKGVVQQADAMRRNRDARDAREREAAQALADQLTGQRIELRARAGEGGRLFGSVTAADVVQAGRVPNGVELDRRKTQLADPLKELGAAEIPVKLHTDVEVTLSVDVVPE